MVFSTVWKCLEKECRFCRQNLSFPSPNSASALFIFCFKCFQQNFYVLVLGAPISLPLQMPAPARALLYLACCIPCHLLAAYIGISSNFALFLFTYLEQVRSSLSSEGSVTTVFQQVFHSGGEDQHAHLWNGLDIRTKMYYLCSLESYQSCLWIFQRKKNGNRELAEGMSTSCSLQ